MPKTILVVDDEPLVLEMVAELFEAEGYSVRRAADGLAALTVAERGGVDLVVADVMMPRLDGASLVRCLHEQGHRIPVVLMSAVVDSVDAPGTPFVRKPFELDHLVALVDRVLRVDPLPPFSDPDS